MTKDFASGTLGMFMPIGIVAFLVVISDRTGAAQALADSSRGRLAWEARMPTTSAAWSDVLEIT